MPIGPQPQNFMGNPLWRNCSISIVLKSMFFYTFYLFFSRAKEKADSIVEHIGYPSELMDVTKLADLYDGLNLNSTRYLGNALNMTVFGTNYSFSKLREKVLLKADIERYNIIDIISYHYITFSRILIFLYHFLKGDIFVI
jgi:membrane metallo-endopeptidase-like protein 1